MRLSRLKKALLILALALSQWLVAAHSLQHASLAPEQACQICLHAQGLDSGALQLAALPTLSLPQQAEIPADLPSAPALPVVLAAASIRGPPSLVS